MRTLFLDTETTGLSGRDEIVEIAIVDEDNNILINTLVKPSQPMSEDAEWIHGISNEMVANAPSWPQIRNQLAEIMTDQMICTYNADFDVRMLRNTCRIHNTSGFRFKIHCAMTSFADFKKSRCYFRLTEAASITGFYKTPEAEQCESHRALGDAMMCRHVYLSLGRLRKARATNRERKHLIETKARKKIPKGLRYDEHLQKYFDEKGTHKRSLRRYRYPEYRELGFLTLSQLTLRNVHKVKFVGHGDYSQKGVPATCLLFRLPDPDD